MEGVNFIGVANQNGATSSWLSSTVGGDTIPIFVSVSQSYTISRNGVVSFVYGWSGMTAAGVGAGILRIHVPLMTLYSGTFLSVPGNGRWVDSGTLLHSTFMTYQFGPDVLFYILPHGAASTYITPADVTATTVNSSFDFSYLGGVS
jgi:hypothetical protein